jgi:hypothetical protein
MITIRPNKMPRLWWLFPWSYARELHRAANAVKAYADQADRCVEMQIRIIEDYRAEVDKLKQDVTALSQSREHWMKKHDRAYEVAMHNEKVIREMEERYEQTLEGQLGKVLAVQESPASRFCRQYKAETGQDAIGHLSAKDMWELTSTLSKKNGGEMTWEELCAERSENIKNIKL